MRWGAEAAGARCQPMIWQEPSVLADEPLCLCHLAALSPIPALSPLWDEASRSLPTSHTEIKLKTLWEKQPFHTSRFNNSTKNHDDEEGPPRARRCARPHRRPRLGRRQLRQAVQQAPGEKLGLAFQAEGERGESREQGGGVGWGGVTNLRRRASEEDSVARRCVPPPPPSSSLSLFSLSLSQPQPFLTLSFFFSSFLPSSLPPLDQLTGARLRVPQLRRPDPRAAEGNRRVHLRQPRHCFHETHCPVLRARADLHAVQVRRRRRARVGAHARHRDVPRDAVRVPGQVCGAAERGVQGQVNIEALRLIVER